MQREFERETPARCKLTPSSAPCVKTCRHFTAGVEYHPRIIFCVLNTLRHPIIPEAMTCNYISAITKNDSFMQRQQKVASSPRFSHGSQRCRPTGFDLSSRCGSMLLCLLFLINIHFVFARYLQLLITTFAGSPSSKCATH